jgi:hypothetical protein
MLRRGFATIGVLCVYAACRESPTPPPPPPLAELVPDVTPASIEVVPNSAILYSPYSSMQFKAIVRNRAGAALPDAKVKWQSTGRGGFGVDSTGLASAVFEPAYDEGSGIVSAVSVANPSVRGSADVTLALLFTMLSVLPDTNVVLAGMTRTLIGRAHYAHFTHPEGRKRVTPTWSSSDPAIVSISDSGQITAVGTGHARITATFNGFRATSEVDVVASPAVKLTSASGGFFTTGQATPETVNRECGLNANDGGVYCWGLLAPDMKPYDRCEQLFWGTGGISQYRYFRCSEIPVRLPTSVTFSAASSGDLGGCALATTKEVYCWGVNSVGELGNGAIDAFGGQYWTERALARISSSDQFRSVHGAGRQRCAIRIDGAAFCWGAGVGSSPTRIGANLSWTTIAETSRYSGYNCGLAADSTAYCWSPGVVSPQQVDPSLRWTGVDVSIFSACALAPSGRAYCWSSSAVVPSPTLVSGDPSLVFIGSAIDPKNFFDHITCGLSAAGDMYCIKLTGSDPISYSLEPADLGGLKLKRFSGSCGIGIDDKAYCWSEDWKTVRLIPGQ